MPDEYDYSQSRRSAQAQNAGPPIITILLIGLSILITLASWTSEGAAGGAWYQLGHFGDLPIYKIWQGHYWALITCTFYHLNIIHILFNMQWLWLLGKRAEADLPPIVYILFLILAAAIGSCIQILISDQTGVGMSGVVYALFGLMWAGRGRFPAWQEIANRRNMEIMIGWGVLCIVATALNWMQIANGAHAGGLLFGLSVGWLWFAPRRRPLWAIPLALLCIASVVSLTWMPWSKAWTFAQGNRAFERHDYAAAIRWYQRSLNRGGDPESCWDNISRAWNNIGYDADHRGDEATAAHAVEEKEAAENKMQAAKGTAPAKTP